MSAWLELCGIGRRYWDASRERVREPEEVCAYLDALGEEAAAGRGLLLLGPVGTGKTSILALVAKEAEGRVSRVWYVTVSRLIRHLLHGSEVKTLRQQTGIERGQPYQVDPREWPLLLLDEFGAAYESDYALAAFEDYLGWRYDRMLATCIAANLTAEQILANAHYGRMVDRWRETCRVVVIGGASQRRPLGDQEAR